MVETIGDFISWFSSDQTVVMTLEMLDQVSAILRSFDNGADVKTLKEALKKDPTPAAELLYEQYMEFATDIFRQRGSTSSQSRS